MNRLKEAILWLSGVVILAAMLLAFQVHAFPAPAPIGFFGSTAAPAAASAATPLTNGLALSLDFNDGTGASINPTSFPPISGVVSNVNTVLVTNLGTGTNAAHFISANSEYFAISAANSGSLARTGSMTIALAYLLHGNTNVAMTMISRGSNNVNGNAAAEYLFRTINTGLLNITRGSGGAGSGSASTSDSVGLITNQWNHATLVLTNGVGWAMYTSGVFCVANTDTNIAFDSTGDFRIGRANAANSIYFNGKMRAIRVWTRALDANGVSSNYVAFTNNAPPSTWGNTY